MSESMNFSMCYNHVSEHHSRETIGRFLKLREPDLVEMWKRRRFRQKQFWSAGIMDVLTVDQHDKWRDFSLFLHVGLDPFPGCVLWCKIWWTNRDPHLVCSYYLNSCHKEGGTYIYLHGIFLETNTNK